MDLLNDRRIVQHRPFDGVICRMNSFWATSLRARSSSVLLVDTVASVEATSQDTESEETASQDTLQVRPRLVRTRCWWGASGILAIESTSCTCVNNVYLSRTICVNYPASAPNSFWLFLTIQMALSGREPEPNAKTKQSS